MADTTSSPHQSAPSPIDVSAQLDRILASAEFARARRLSDFLRYVVEAALEDGAVAPKGYTVGIEALGRPVHFDVDGDPIVRVTATRVRSALAGYYAGEGRDDPVVIELPRGNYVPTARWARRGGPVGLWTPLRAWWERLLASLRISLLPPPSTEARQFDGRDIRQIQQAQGAAPARARRPRRG